MHVLLKLARTIDLINEIVGKAVRWLVLASIALAAVNAVFGQWLGAYSNTLLESQWYFFAAIFLLVAGYTLKHNGHVRIDVFYGRLGTRSRAIVDLVGSALFLLPLCVLMIWLAWPGFAESYVSGERSPDAGGLARWPVRALIPLGFILLAMQAVAEIIKRLAVLRGSEAAPAESSEERV